MNFRIGFGYDVHQLAAGRRLILGGVEISHEKGIVAHSDGDVLVHAICDALLGAAGLRDIGYHFPDTAEKYRGISSMVLLKDTISLLGNKGYQVGNIDTTLCLQRPKIKDYVSRMISNLANAMNTETTRVSVKATTTENLGFVGEEKGVAAYAVALIYTA